MRAIHSFLIDPGTIRPILLPQTIHALLLILLLIGEGVKRRHDLVRVGSGFGIARRVLLGRGGVQTDGGKKG